MRVCITPGGGVRLACYQFPDGITRDPCAGFWPIPRSSPGHATYYNSTHGHGSLPMRGSPNFGGARTIFGRYRPSTCMSRLDHSRRRAPWS